MAMQRTRICLLICGLFLFICGTLRAQERTEETVTTTDSTGNTVTTKVVRISTSEDITPRTNVIVINPLKFLIFYNLSYYRAISSHIAVGGGLQTPTLEDVSGIGVNGEIRFHPSGKALRGFYVAPNISYNSLSNSGENVTVFSAGVLAGWQWFPGDDFAIGLGIGVDRYFLSDDDGNELLLFSSYEGTVPALRFDIGYGW